MKSPLSTRKMPEKSQATEAYVINLSDNYFNSDLAFGSFTNMCWDDGAKFMFYIITTALLARRRLMLFCIPLKSVS